MEENNAILRNTVNQEVLFLVNDNVLNAAGQTLGYYHKDNLYSINNKKLGEVSKSGDFLNHLGEKIGQVKNEQVYISNNQPLMEVKGTSIRNQAKIALAFLYFLQ